MTRTLPKPFAGTSVTCFGPDGQHRMEFDSFDKAFNYAHDEQLIGPETDVHIHDHSGGRVKTLWYYHGVPQ